MKLLSSKKQAVKKGGDALPKLWFEYHAEKERIRPGINEINVFLTLIPKPAHTLETQY